MRTAVLVTAMLTLVLVSARGAEDLPRLVVPGDGTVDGTAIVPYDNAWSVIVRNKDGTVAHDGIATDHVAFREVDGRKYLLRIEGEVEDDGSRSDTSLTQSDPVTLAPFAGEHYASDGSVERRHYDGAHVEVRTTAAPGAPEVAHSFDLAQPVFDFRGNMTGLLLRAQPLKRGYAARIPWADDKGTVHLTQIRVLRRETVDAGFMGPVKTWVVSVGAAPSHVTYWIADVRPYVIKVVIEAPDAVTSWEMIR